MFEFSRQTLFQWAARLLVLFTAMPVHECAHGLAADRLGDPTPRESGRLTLNPFKHLDFLGCAMIFFFGFGWAKPVMVDSRNFQHPRRDMAIVSVAGPGSNFLFAFVILVIYKISFGLWDGSPSVVTSAVFLILETMLVTNLSIGVFNLIPMPPLDGSKILGAFLPERAYWTLMRYERFIALALLLCLWRGYLDAPLLFLTRGMYDAINWLTLPIDWLFGWNS